MKRSLKPEVAGQMSLRPIEASDLAATLAWRNRDEARVWFKTSSPISTEQHQAWFDKYLQRDDDFVFIVEYEQKPVGQAAVYGIDWEQRIGEVGRFLVAPDAAGKGYIKHACAQLINLCHEQLGLSEVFLEVFEKNARAISVYLANGFSEDRRYDGLIRMTRKLGGH